MKIKVEDRAFSVQTRNERLHAVSLDQFAPMLPEALRDRHTLLYSHESEMGPTTFTEKILAKVLSAPKFYPLVELYGEGSVLYGSM